MHTRDSNPRTLSPSPFGPSLSTAFSTPFHGRAGSDCSVSPLSSTTASPTSSPTSTFRRLYRGHAFSGSRSDGETRSRSQSPFSLHSMLRARSSLVLLRRRPSAVDMALSEERSRCGEDSIERQGLSLMEPRPVDPVAIPMDLNAHIFEGSPASSKTPSQEQSSRTSQPRFVMGGIFEVMEGRA